MPSSATERTILYNIAIVQTSNLIHKACINPSKSNLFPERIFGVFCTKESEPVTQWIEFLKQELETSQNEQIKLNIVTALGIFFSIYFYPSSLFLLGANWWPLGIMGSLRRFNYFFHILVQNSVENPWQECGVYYVPRVLNIDLQSLINYFGHTIFITSRQ